MKSWSSPALVLLAIPFTSSAVAQSTSGPAPGPAHAHSLDCGFLSAQRSLSELQAAVRRGEIPAPALRELPTVAPRAGAPKGGAPACLSSAHVFPYEDTAGLLLTNYSNGELIDLMVDAANDLLAAQGDLYDFVGFWVNFDPDHLIGAAFYMQIVNDIQGIGDALYDNHAALGLAGSEIEGFVMMWNVNNSLWQPGSGSNADFTRLALGQEFEHRFAMFLPPLLDGRVLQGDNGSCGRQAHWNWKVDGQGSSMEISEWVGSSPAQLQGSFVTFNTDIPGSVFSYTDLYLMGYVTPQEMDFGNSELRYMDNSGCGAIYGGPISSFASSDIIASAGPRVPDAAAEDRYYRTGWIMIHQPGDPPSPAELDKAVAILDQHQLDWAHSTLGRGTMSNQLFEDCNCNGIPDAQDIASGGSTDLNGNGVPDDCECVGLLYCNPKITSSGCLPTVSVSGVASATLGSGFTVEATAVEPGNVGIFFYGLDGPASTPFQGGTLCVQPPAKRTPSQVSGGAGPCSGALSIDFNSFVAAGSDPQLVAGSFVNGQFWFRDPPQPTFGTGLSDAASFLLCP